MQHCSNETGRTGTQRTGDDGPTRAPRTATSRRGFLVAAGATVGLGGLVSGTASAQEISVTSEFVDDRIAEDETTELDLTVNEIPDAGTAGVTVEVELDGAEFTGDVSTDAAWSHVQIDRTDSGDASSATVTTVDLDDSVAAGDTNVHVGAATVDPSGSADVEATISAAELITDDDESIELAASGATLSVGDDGGDGGLPPADGDGGDGGSGGDDGSSGDDGGDGSQDDGEGDSDDGMTDDDPVPGDSGEGDSDDGSGDSNEGGDSSDDDSSTDDGGDSDGDDGADETPGFGVIAAGTALLTAAGARLALDDDGEPEQ